MSDRNSNRFSIAGTVTVATGKSGAILLKTPVVDYIHLTGVFIRSNAAVSVSLLEDYTETVGNTVADIPARNRNRVSTIASTLASLEGGADIVPLAGTTPLTLATVPVAASVPAIKVDGIEGWVLSQNKNYLIAISNSSGGNAIVGYELLWSEESSI